MSSCVRFAKTMISRRLASTEKIFQWPSGFKVVDSHVHFFGPQLQYPWLRGQNRVQEHIAGTLDEISEEGIDFVDKYTSQQKDTPVIKVVHVQAECADPVKETEWLQQQAEKYGVPHGIVPFVDLGNSFINEDLIKQKKFQNVRGIRQMLNWSNDHPNFRFAHRDYLKEQSFRTGFALLEKHNLTFDLQVNYSQLLEAAKFAGSFPKIKIVLDHAGFPLRINDQSYTDWQQGMKFLAKNTSNVSVKLSGLRMFDHNLNVDSLRPYVDFVLNTFGVDRCFWGSNWPIDHLRGLSYSDLLQLYVEATKELSSVERLKVFHDNASIFYGL